MPSKGALGLLINILARAMVGRGERKRIETVEAQGNCVWLSILFVCFTVLLLMSPASNSCTLLGELGWSSWDHCVDVG